MRWRSKGATIERNDHGMEQNPEQEDKIGETLNLLKKIWVFFLIGLVAACFYNEARFPGFRDQPLAGEAYLWKIERVLFFGLLGLGLLTDIVQTRRDREKAFLFLFASLIMGGMSTVVGAYQFRVFDYFLGAP